VTLAQDNNVIQAFTADDIDFNELVDWRLSLGVKPLHGRGSAAPASIASPTVTDRHQSNGG
jgi:hypothetical protein